MAGGKGTRFWPHSRSNCPKQFLSIMNEQTMLQTTVQRLLGFLPIEDIYVVTLQKHTSLVKDQLPMLPNNNIFIEPIGRDTAACIGLSALQLLLNGEDPVLITLPSDHFISEDDQYLEALQLAAQKAEEEPCVVTLGIKPTRPETGYGYIRIKPQSAVIKNKVVTVEQFVEKPSIDVAERISVDGQYFWNTGTFIWKASTIFNLIQQHMPPLYQKLQEIKNLLQKKGSEAELLEIYTQIEKISIDYGVIEKCESIYMIPVQFTWDDVGNWDALERSGKSDDDSNQVKGIHEGIDTKNCFIHGKGKQLVATVGIEDLIIVTTEDAILICHKDRTQDIKKLYELLEKKDLQKYV